LLALEKGEIKKGQIRGGRRNAQKPFFRQRGGKGGGLKLFPRTREMGQRERMKEGRIKKRRTVKIENGKDGEEEGKDGSARIGQVARAPLKNLAKGAIPLHDRVGDNSQKSIKGNWEVMICQTV